VPSRAPAGTSAFTEGAGSNPVVRSREAPGNGLFVCPHVNVGGRKRAAGSSARAAPVIRLVGHTSTPHSARSLLQVAKSSLSA
jgi:hypothetical protein